MKRLLFILLVLLIPTVILGQVTRQIDTDSLAVSTASTLATYSPRWESANINFVGCTGHLKLAISPADTTWTDKKWYIMPAYTTLTVTKSKDLGISGVYKILYKCASGTGALLITGTKTAD